MNFDFNSVGKGLIVLGAAIILAGIFMLLFNKIPFLGKLPGDVLVQKKNFTFYFPVVTCIVISVVLTLIFYLINKFKQ